MSKKIKLLSTLLCLLVAISSMTFTASAVSFTVGDKLGVGKVLMAENKALTADGAVTYAKATYTNSHNETQAVYSMEFNPTTSNYMPYIYSKYTGCGSNVFATANAAEKNYGVNVIAGVNATFFDMATGSTDAGYWVHDGRLAQATDGLKNDIITFNSDGEMNIVNSKLDFKLYLNGKEITNNGRNGLAHINKHLIKVDAQTENRFCYWDAECGTMTDSVIAGTEILCKKLDNGELSIGNTLKGEVINIRDNSFNSAVDVNEFVLYIRNGSTLESSIANLKVGDTFKISVNETIESSRRYTENANTALSAQYKIINEGKYAPTDDVIGMSHYSQQAKRTVLGKKADGSIVIISTAGGSTGGTSGLTIPEVGQLALDEGCVTAYNLDGGGSTTVVTTDGNGNLQYNYIGEGTYGRSVANSFLIVERKSIDTKIATALNALVTANRSNTSRAVKDAISDADAVVADKKSLTSDYTRVYMALQSALSGKAELDNIISKISAISYKDYSEAVLNLIWASYDEAAKISVNNEATEDEIDNITNKLSTYYNMTGKASINVSKGKHYTKLGGTNSYSLYMDTDNSELTDDTFASAFVYPYGSSWVGFNNLYKGGDEGEAPYYDVTIDLEASERNLTQFIAYSEVVWKADISAPSSVVVSVSDNGVDFKEAGIASTDTTNIIRSDADKADTSKLDTANVVYKLNLAEGVSGRYVKFHIVGVKGKQFVFVSELQVLKSEAHVDKALFVTDFNKKIMPNNSIIFTPDYTAELTSDNANLDFSRAIAAQWDNDLQVYKVIQTAQGTNGNVIKTVPNNGFVIGVHSESGDAIANKAYADSAKVGDILDLHGIDITKKSMHSGSFITIKTLTVNDKIKENATIAIDGKYINGVRDEQTVDEIAANFKISIEITDLNGKIITGSALVGTGSVVTVGTESYTIFVKGDIDGDGIVSAIDYLFVKKACIGTAKLSDIQLKSACLSGDPAPTSIDCLKIKKHIIGTGNLFS